MAAAAPSVLKKKHPKICTQVQTDGVGEAFLTFYEIKKMGRVSKVEQYSSTLSQQTTKCNPIGI